ncbi:effector protein Tle3 domain-containing protein, partial [Derxia gummosa]|uniref:Effector protein Tle3 domain-containing protein n=1 Tax=Derxia gummosa DSM 723 TaxID=1121388 RepID=A0A8B6XBX9_9BURK
DATGQLVITREETPNEMKRRLMEDTDLRNANENSYHSGVPANAKHHEFVTAYDLSLGEPVPFEMEYFGWLEYLRAVADWRVKWQSDKKVERDSTAFGNSSPLPEHVLKWKNAEQDSAAVDLIASTYRYHTDGTLPSNLPSLAALRLITNITIKHRRESSARD